MMIEAFSFELIATGTDDRRTQAMAWFAHQTQSTPVARKTIVVIRIVFVIGKGLHLFNGFLTFHTLMKLNRLIIRKFLFAFAMAFWTSRRRTTICFPSSVRATVLPLWITAQFEELFPFIDLSVT